jgi:hypothetical protein
MREIFILGYIAPEVFEKRLEKQKTVCEYWLEHGYRVHVLDSVLDDQTWSNNFSSEIVRLRDERFKQICYARNTALEYTSTDDLVILADNDAKLRDMSDYGLDTFELVDILHDKSDADIVYAAPPTMFIKDYFTNTEHARSHLELGNQNSFKGTLMWVRGSCSHRFDTRFDEPYEIFPFRPGEDYYFGITGKMNNYKVRLAKQLIQWELGGVGQSNWCRNTKDRSRYDTCAEFFPDNFDKRKFNRSYAETWGRRDLLDMKKPSEEGLFSF